MSDAFARLSDTLRGRYTIERELGRGGMATVYLAVDEKHQRQVAVKVLRPELTAGLEAERFLREIRTTARLNHAHILPLHDSGRAGEGDDEFLFFVTPYVEGETLRQRLTREGQLPIDEAVRLTLEVADALAYAHRMGVIHRDIKPENILLRDGRALVADFGIARALDDGAEAGLTQSGLAIGTPAYMSPEQALGGTVDERTDVYALGCVLFEMLGGAAPFTGPNVPALLARKSLDTVPALRETRSDVPVALERVVQQALARDPADRFGSAAGLAEALGAGTHSPMRGGPTARVRRLALGAAGVVLLAGLALAFRTGILIPGAASASIDPRRAIMVFPFDVVGDDSTLHWVREASVSLLNVNLEGWDELRVVDRRRLLSLARARGHALEDPLGFEEARELAVDADAGTMVLGEVTSVGGRVEIVARAWNVRTSDPIGEPIRLAAVAGQDVRTLYDEIAAHLLGLSGAPAVAPDVRAATTSSLAAYQDYDEGLRRLYRWELPQAEEHFRAAIDKDSTFAAAYHYLAFADYWRLHPGSIRDEWAEWTEVALRFGAVLPQHMRDHFGALNALVQHDFARAREAYRGLVEADSMDVEALLQRGDVEVHDYSELIRLPNDHYIPAANLNVALTAFEQAVRIDDRFSLGYGHYFDLQFELVDGCEMFLIILAGVPDSIVSKIPETNRFRNPASDEGFLPTANFDACWQGDSIAWIDSGRVGGDRPIDEDRWRRAVSMAQQWQRIAPSEPRPHQSLYWLYSNRRGRSTPMDYRDLTNRMLEHEHARLELTEDTTAGELARLGEHFLETAELDSAIAYMDRALESSAGTIRSGALEGAHFYRGRLRSVLDRRRPIQGETFLDPNNSNQVRVGQPAVNLTRRAAAVGNAGTNRPWLDAVVDSIIKTLPSSSSGYVSRSSLFARQTHAIGAALLAVGPATMLRWMAQLERPRAAWRALVQFRLDSTAAAAAALRGALEDDLSATETFVVGTIAQQLGMDSVAVELFTTFDYEYHYGSYEALWVRSFALRARSYESLGDTANAVRYYEWFTRLWEGADPDLQPQVDSARQRLARLRRTGG